MRKRKAEQVDEYAETQVLVEAPHRSKHLDADALSLYAEYERELAQESAAASRPSAKRR
jgi:hypothetical protein